MSADVLEQYQQLAYDLFYEDGDYEDNSQDEDSESDSGSESSEITADELR